MCRQMIVMVTVKILMTLRKTEIIFMFELAKLLHWIS